MLATIANSTAETPRRESPWRRGRPMKLPRVIDPCRAAVGWRRRFIGVSLLLSDVD